MVLRRFRAQMSATEQVFGSMAVHLVRWRIRLVLGLDYS
jgi:hypothetical protein